MNESRFPAGWDGERVKRLIDHHESKSDDELAAEDEAASGLSQPKCPFVIGDAVVFTPSARTRGLYQNIEGFGVRVGQKLVIRDIRDDMYLYFEGGVGGWPWNEFLRATS